MPHFAYTARARDGTIQTGRFDAASEDEALTSLQHRGLFVVSLGFAEAVASPMSKRLTVSVRRVKARRMHGRVTVGDHVLLCQQLATLVEAGVPLLKSLEVVSAQVESRMLLSALDHVRKDVEGGRTLKDALATHPAVFSAMWLNLVETGEASGHLAEAMQQLARHFERSRHLRTEVQTAMTYPAFLICASALVMVVFMYFIIPKFSSMFGSMGMELPLLTKLVLAASEISRKYAVAIIVAAGAIGYLLIRYLRTEPGQWTADRLILRLPLLGRLMTYAQLAEFMQGLGTLLDSGVPLLSSLQILSNSATNKLYGQAIGEVREAVKEGKPMAEPMAKIELFPPMAVQMVLVGEEVGELGKMVGRVSSYYEERAETLIARMTKLFEPFAIVFMGGLVLVIVLSIFLPIFKMSSGVNIK
ncbi:MAG: type II secretion system F family protein [Candidatus Omnitrophica bacterium]|nr:type II secretion system F family protein [Candidatus Omnitrophota bacterium]